MKNLMFIAFLVPFWCFGQVEILSNTIDDFTKTQMISTKGWKKDVPVKSEFINSDKNSNVSFFITYNKKKEGNEVYYFKIYFMNNKFDFGCMSENSGKILFLFNDDTTIEGTNRADTNCKESIYNASFLLCPKDKLTGGLFYGIQEESIAKLSLVGVKKIRVTFSKGYIDYDIKEEKQFIFAQHLKAIKEELNK